ncbi:MAG TPA: hypothetical protein VK473_01340 [Terriglobales bacterium]|nr:hypothetical protein [Terriglobales bacterium]
MLEKFLQLLSIACRHRNVSKPFTAAEPVRKPEGDWDSVSMRPMHYVVCLDCGKKFAYDWTNMRILR